MRVVVHGVHIQVSPELRDHVQEQLAEPLERLFPNEAVELDVHLVDGTGGSKGGLDKECRVTLHSPHMAALHITEVSDDFYKSVSLARDRLDNAARRQLDRLHNHSVGERA